MMRSGTASVITVGSQAVRIGVQAASMIVLARILSPSDFGLVAMVYSALFFVIAILEAALAPAIVQKKDLTPEQLASFFLLTLLASSVLALFFAALAPLVSELYDEARILPLAYASTGIVLLSGISAFYLAVLQRRRQYFTLAVLDVVPPSLALAVAIWIAIRYESFWAIWTFTGANYFATCLIGAVACRFPMRKLAPFGEILDLVGVSVRMSIGGILNHADRTFDNVLIGYFWGQTALGLYDRAYKLMLLPLQLINAPFKRMMLPTLAGLRERADEYRDAYLFGLLCTTLPGWILIAFLMASSEQLFASLLGTHWIAAAPLFTVLGVACMLQMVSTTLITLLVTQGRSREVLRIAVSSTLLYIVCFTIGVRWGAFGVAAALSAAELIRTPLLIAVTTRVGPVHWSDILNVLNVSMVAAAASFAVSWSANEMTQSANLVTLTLVGALSLLLAMVATCSMQMGRLFCRKLRSMAYQYIRV